MLTSLYKKLWSKWQTKVEYIDSAIQSVDYKDHVTIHERIYLSDKYYKALEKRNYYREKVLYKAVKNSALTI